MATVVERAIATHAQPNDPGKSKLPLSKGTKVLFDSSTFSLSLSKIPMIAGKRAKVAKAETLSRLSSLTVSCTLLQACSA